MIRTVVIFAAIIVVIVVLLPRDKHNGDPARVDYSGPLDLVRHRAPFHVYGPEGLPASWIANAVRVSVPQAEVSTSGIDVGFFDNSKDAYVRLQQSDAPDLVAATLGKTAARTGSAVIGGVSWQTWTDSAGAAALVRAPDPHSTIVLSGKADAAVLPGEESYLAAHLR